MVLDATPRHGVSIRQAIDDGRTAYFDVLASQSVIEIAKTQIGRPYDFRGALGLGLRRDWREPGHWDCSEYVAWAFEEDQNRLIRTDHLDQVSPADLLMSPRLLPVI